MRKLLTKLLNPPSKVPLFFSITLALYLTLLGSAIISSFQRLSENTEKLFKNVALIRDKDMILVTEEQLVSLRKAMRSFNLKVQVFPLKVKRRGNNAFVVAGIPQLEIEMPRKGIELLLMTLNLKVKADKPVAGLKYNAKKLKEVTTLPLTNSPLDYFLLVPKNLEEDSVYTYLIAIAPQEDLRKLKALGEALGLRVMDFHSIRRAIQKANESWERGMWMIELSLIGLTAIIIALLLSSLLESRYPEVKYLLLIGVHPLKVLFMILMDLLEIWAISFLLSSSLVWATIRFLSQAINLPFSLRVPLPHVLSSLIFLIILSAFIFISFIKGKIEA